MEETESIFTMLKQLADGLIRLFPRNCEVAIHDLRTLHKSLIYIVGNVTRREPGAPITDLVVKALHREGNNIADRHNYKTITEDGRALKSSTLFVRNRKGKVIGAFCVNFDTTDYFNAVQALEVFAGANESTAAEQSETFAHSINDTIKSLFEQAVFEIGKRPTTMSTEEKITLVKSLETKGTFQIKGAVDQVAVMLGVSKFTVYNYLKKVRAKQAVFNTNPFGQSDRI